LQEYIQDIEDCGEWSLVFVDGKYTHAARKIPKSGDFRVQVNYGGTVSAEIPSSKLLLEAEKVISCLPQTLLYARVDLVECKDGKIVLMELELIEPEMFLEHNSSATNKLFSAITKICQQKLEPKVSKDSSGTLV
jgi:glutathione synthase/RimK-type ligase-like ATP-grasp enzyme